MTDEVKNICLEICELLFSSSLPITLKAKLFHFDLLLILDFPLSLTRCLPSNLVALLFSKRSSYSLMNLVISVSFSHFLESLEEFYKFLMSQDNDFWSDVIEDYRGVLLSLHQTLTSMKRESVQSPPLTARKEAYLCLLKLLSTYTATDAEYQKYAVECGNSIGRNVKHSGYPAETHDSRRRHAHQRAVRVRRPAAVAPVVSLSVCEIGICSSCCTS